jgi:hypothetical protein
MVVCEALESSSLWLPNYSNGSTSSGFELSFPFFFWEFAKSSFSISFRFKFKMEPN